MRLAVVRVRVSIWGNGNIYGISGMIQQYRPSDKTEGRVSRT